MRCTRFFSKFQDLGAAKEIPEFIQIKLNDFSQIGLNEWLMI
jgi:hypothetical protein